MEARGGILSRIPVFRHDGRGKSAYNAFLIGASLVGTIVTSYRLTFRVPEPDPLYWILTVIYLLDIPYSFNLAVRRGLVVLEDRRSISLHYLRTWFAVDVLAAFPLAAFAGAAGAAASQVGLDVFLVAKLLKMAKITKVNSVFRDIREGLSINPSVMRLVTFAFWFSIAVHLMACGWCFIGASEPGRPPGDQYIRALYWCLTTIATIGYGDYHPSHESNLQMVYTIVVTVFGVGMYGYIIGNVATLVANLDIARANYQKRMEEINVYLRARRVPADLQTRVRAYYAYLWETRKSVSSVSIIDELPPTLGLEVLLFLNRTVLSKVALLRDAKEVFIREIVSRLKPMVYLPNDYIMREGEYGDCMYFLTGGDVEVVASGRRVAKLGPGSPIGEMALIQGEKRTADVRALSYCDVYRLGKDDFDALRTRYPEFDSQVREVMRSRGQGGAPR